jgi:hypothetical protein
LFQGAGAAYNRAVPKRPRQSHIPAQIRKRKPARRPFANGTDVAPLDAPAVEPSPAGEAWQAEPPEPRPHRIAVVRAGRRQEQLARSQDQLTTRIVPGQLPTFERAYLMDELRRIFIISAVLLALIIVLAVVLR